MSAKDYSICPALFSAYIAKTDKKNPNLMTNDRREITEGEVLMLIDWYLNKETKEGSKGLSFKSLARDGMRIEMRYEKIEK